MRPCLALGVLAACGRLNFAPLDDANIDASPYCAQALDVAIGRKHGCAVVTDGSVWCWGQNYAHQVDPSTDAAFILEPVQVTLPKLATAVRTGNAFTCALLDDQTVWCWGRNDAGELGTANTNDRGPLQIAGVQALELATGAQTGCVRRASDSAIQCWGESRFGENGSATSSPSLQLVAGTAGATRLRMGHRHGCFLDATGQVKCWGRNVNGQLGASVPAQSTTPLAVAGAASEVALAAGARVSCAVDANGTLRCWGRNRYGELGTTDMTPSASPVVSQATDVADVTLGIGGGCALRRDGSVVCWGDDQDAGDGTLARGQTLRTSRARNVTKLAGGFYDMCAISNGEALCWGDNESGELGRGVRGIATTPTPVTIPGFTPTGISVGRQHVCATDGTQVLCWGNNGDGRIGNGTADDRASPAVVATGLGTITGVAAGAETSCAWNGAGAVCWGANAFGQTGNGAPSPNELSPVPVQGLAGPITMLGMGNEITCALIVENVYCWGKNNHGQLGRGNTTPSTSPVNVGLTTVNQVAVGFNHICAVRAAGELYCWGGNDNGEVGNNSTTDQLAPVAIGVGGQLVGEVGVGEDFTCARTVAGAVYCWGRNDLGQLGQGDRAQRTVPTLVPGLGTAVQYISVGGVTACAHLIGGEVRCWGGSYFGQIPTGTATDADTPVSVPALSNDPDELGLNLLGGCMRKGAALSCWGSTKNLASGDLSEGIPEPPHIPCR